MYGKFFKSAFSGSLMASGPEVFAVWAYVIAHTVESRVELNPRLLAAVIGSTPDRMEKAIEVLCSPDPCSRSQENEGRRMVKEGAYQYFVVNHAKYKQIRSEEDRREYNKIKKREERQRKSATVKHDVIDSQRQSSLSANKEADTEADTEVKKKRNTRAASGTSVSVESLIADGVDAKHAEDWLAVRRSKRLVLTETAWLSIKAEAASCGISPAEAVMLAASNGWAGFKSAWVENVAQSAGRNSKSDVEPTWRKEQRERHEAFLGPYAAKSASSIINMEPTNAIPAKLR